MIYLITCPFCKLQYAGSAITFEENIPIHKRGVNTGKRKLGTAKHILETF